MRISATLLESFRRWVEMEDGETADQVEQELHAQIRREFKRTPAMDLGRAYEQCLQYPQKMLDGYYSTSRFPDHRFEASAIENLLDRLSPGLFQVPCAKHVFIREVGPVAIALKLDHISGSQISDFKATLKSFDADKYLDSYQWRIYCLAFDASLFTYHVVGLKDEGDYYSLRSLDTMNVFPYPSMEQDIRALVQDFVSYVNAKGLVGYLEPNYPVRQAL